MNLSELDPRLRPISPDAIRISKENPIQMRVATPLAPAAGAARGAGEPDPGRRAEGIVASLDLAALRARIAPTSEPAGE